MRKNRNNNVGDEYTRELYSQDHSMRKKVYSSLCMLLIASLLMTGVSYAWLTMSISPEATDIDVTVTGNGSLEIALATTESMANLGSIRSGAGDSGYEYVAGDDDEDRVISYSHDANTKWGNLIDLSNDYGLSEISLYPAMLNIANGHILENPIKIADYGADGRIESLNSTTAYGAYDKSTQSFFTTPELRYGVRALGVVADTGLWSALTNTVNVAGDLNYSTVSSSAADLYDCLMLLDPHEGETAESIAKDDALALLGGIVNTVCDTEGDGWIANLDAVTRQLIVACSGYDEEYVSVSSKDMIKLAESEITTAELIEAYVLEDTDLADFCQLYTRILDKAEAAKTAYDVMLERAAVDENAAEPAEDEETAEPAVQLSPLPEQLAWDDIKDVIVPLMGDRFTYEYIASYTRTATRPNPNDETKTITSTDYGTIKKGSAAEIAAALEELKTLNEDIGETEVKVSHYSGSRYINVENDDCVVSMIAALTGSVYSACGNVTESEIEFTEILRAVEPEGGSAAANLGAVRKTVDYNNSVLELQTLWNELPAQRSAMETALYAELAALADIYAEKNLSDEATAEYERVLREYNEAMAALEQELTIPPQYVTQDEKTAKIQEGIEANKKEFENILADLDEKKEYKSPESADINKLISHINTFENALEFYDAYTRAAALAYSSKGTTSYDVYSRVSKVIEENAPLEEVINALGENFATQYSAALADINAVSDAIATTRGAINNYNQILEDEANGEEYEEIQHPTAEEDIALRRAFADITSLVPVDTVTGNYYGYGDLFNEEDCVTSKFGIFTSDGYEFSRYNEFWRDPSIQGRPYFKVANAFDENHDSIIGCKLGFECGFSSPGGKVSDIVTAINIIVGVPVENEEIIVDIAEKLNSYYVDCYSLFREIRELYYYHGYYDMMDIDAYTALGMDTEEKPFTYDTISDIRTVLRDIKTRVMPKRRQLTEYLATVLILSRFTEEELAAQIIIPAKTDAPDTEPTTEPMIITVEEALREMISQSFTETACPNLADFADVVLDAVRASEYEEIKALETKLAAILSTSDDPDEAYNIICEMAKEFDEGKALWNKANNLLTEKFLNSSLGRKFTWDDIYPVLVLIGGEYRSMVWEYSAVYSVYLSSGTPLERLVALFSDKRESELYDRKGAWGYYEDVPGELDLRLFGLGGNYSGSGYYHYYSDLKSLYRGCYEHDEYTETNAEGESITYPPNIYLSGWVLRASCGLDYSRLLIRTNNFTADNAITPLYELATADVSVETDRSTLYARLRGRVDASKETMLSAYSDIDLSAVSQYLSTSLLYGATVDPSRLVVTDKEGNAAEITAEERRGLIPAGAASYSYSDLLGLRAALNTLSSALTAYENNLKLEFEIWASSANGTKKAYSAVLEHYTDPLAEMLDASGVPDSNVYAETYKTLSRAQSAIDQATAAIDAEIAGLEAAGGAETQFILPGAMLNAISPLAYAYSVPVTVDENEETGDRSVSAKLEISDSVLGDILSLYSGTNLYSEQAEGETAPAVDEDGSVLPTETVSVPVVYLSAGTNSIRKTETVTMSGGADRRVESAANKASASVMTDAYAMAIDLIFRTNAVDASLMLQTDAAQRIYADKTSDDAVGASTLGGGSTITYDKNGMSDTVVSRFNDALRIVFADTRTGEILACAKSFISEEMSGANKVTSQIYLCDFDISDSGVLTAGDIADSAAIRPLTKNTATPVTAYIYLDGNAVDNSGAPTLGDMQLDINLQFSTDVDLYPSQYSPLGNQKQTN